MKMNRVFKYFVTVLALLPSYVVSMDTLIIDGDLGKEYHNTVNIHSAETCECMNCFSR